MNIIITGCSKGIGFELAKLFCKDTDNFVIGISRTKIEKSVITELGNNTLFNPITYDLQKITNDLYDKIFLEIKSVDVLINNAGLLINKSFEDLNDNDFDNMFNVNVKSVFKLIQMLLPHFSKNSHIVNISSMGGFQGSAKFNGLSLYSSSKAALNILTECMAEEFKERHIKVNSLSLGAVDTEMLRLAFPGYQAQLSPIEMADYIKKFAENSHNYLNGKVIPVSISTP